MNGRVGLEDGLSIACCTALHHITPLDVARNDEYEFMTLKGILLLVILLLYLVVRMFQSALSLSS